MGRTAITTATSVAKTGARAGQSTVWAGLSTASRVAGVVGVVFDVVFIPVDLGFMIKAAIDVHKYETTGKSNSAVATKIGELITQLEEHRDELIKSQV